VSVRRGLVTVIVRKRRREDHWRWSALSRYSAGSSTSFSPSWSPDPTAPGGAINPG